MVNALELSKQNLNVGNVTLFSEVPLEHPNMPGIGPLVGHLDFLSAAATDTESIHHYQSIPQMSESYLLVVDDKQTSPIGKNATQAQLLSQLITLDSLDPYKTGVIH